jgi:tripartite-type tricarboxylate transporter receptor subunit TctC
MIATGIAHNKQASFALLARAARAWRFHGGDGMQQWTVIANATVLLAAGTQACAQTYPERPIRLVVNFPAGGNVDTIARLQTAQLERQLGRTIVVDNRAGANGIIGIEIAAKAAPDGYTLLFSPSSIVVNQVVYPKIPYDIRRDFAPITNAAAGSGYLLVANPAVPARTVRELIALAKSTVKPLTYSTAGTGNPQHFLGELFNARAGTRMIHVPYKGVPQAVIALLGGEVNVTFMPPPAVAQHIRDGKMRALGFTGAARWDGMPDVPTIAESALPGFEMRTGWQGWFAPANTPLGIVAKLNAEIRMALQTPKVRDYLVAASYDVIGNSPGEFRKFIDAELKRYAEIARVAKIKVE